MNLFLDHVSILVDSVDATANLFADSGIHIGKKEAFRDVGTEEIYIGNPEYQALLLLQAAAGDGAYRRALEKRGTGIHHLAISTDDFESSNEKLSILGWFVHPHSLRKYKRGTTVFYVRPGVHTILELITKKDMPTGLCLISEVLIHTEPGKENCINGIGVSGLKGSSTEKTYIVIQGKKWHAGLL